MNEHERIAFYLIHCLLSLHRLNKWVGLTAEVAGSSDGEKCDSWESSSAVIISAKWMIESRLDNIGSGHVFACQGSPQIPWRLLNLICGLSSGLSGLSGSTSCSEEAGMSFSVDSPHNRHLNPTWVYVPLPALAWPEPIHSCRTRDKKIISQTKQQLFFFLLAGTWCLFACLFAKLRIKNNWFLISHWISVSSSSAFVDTRRSFTLLLPSNPLLRVSPFGNGFFRENNPQSHGKRLQKLLKSHAQDVTIGWMLTAIFCDRGCSVAVMRGVSTKVDQKTHFMPCGYCTLMFWSLFWSNTSRCTNKKRQLSFILLYSAQAAANFHWNHLPRSSKIRRITFPLCVFP